jgi:malate synthase
MVINALNSGAKTFMADFEGTGVATFPSDPLCLTIQLLYRCFLADLQGDA